MKDAQLVAAVLLVSFAAVMLLIVGISYYDFYGPISHHKNLCEQKLQKGNAPRNVKCVLAKEVFVPEET